MGETKVVEFNRLAREPAPEGSVLGWVVRADASGLWVDYPQNPRGPTRAVSTVAFARARIETAIEERQDAVLLLLSTGQPVVLGLCEANPVVEGELVGAPPSSATVDGDRVRLEGRNEVVLRCGKASITLRRNGRVVIRGVQVESRASGRNRIKGGSVLVN